MIGATDAKQFLVLIDPKSLKTKPDGGIRVRPEHIHQVLRQHAEIDQHAFSKQFPLDVAAKDELQDEFAKPRSY